MARLESAKEDLLRDATAFVERIEVAPIAGEPGANIIAGFRRDGAASIFFGDDPVYQFNAAGELRRAYFDGLLFKAVHGRLVSLQRARQRKEVQLSRHDLTDAEQREFLTRMQGLLKHLAAALSRDEYVIVGQAPNDVDVVGRLKTWLKHQDGARIAAAPHVHSPDM